MPRIDLSRVRRVRVNAASCGHDNLHPYASIFAGAAAFPTDAGPVPDVLFRCHTAPWTGYGLAAIQLGCALERVGLSVGYLTLGDGGGFLPPSPFVEARRRNAFEASRCRVQMAPPNVNMADGTDAVFTMWETSRILPEFAARLNQAKLVLVPCTWNAGGFRASGVTSPVAVVPLGIDPDLYHPMPFRDDGVFRVGMAARVSHGGVRKGIDEGILAFQKAFPRRKVKDALLAVKVWEDCLEQIKEGRNDPRVVFMTQPLPGEEMPLWYWMLDVYFAPTKSEGFGLHTLAAMAVGRPVIAAPVTGTQEFWEDGVGWELDGEWATASAFYYETGEWYVPHEESMVHALRDAYERRDEVRRRGWRAAQVASGWTWDRSAGFLVRALAEAGLLGSWKPPPFRPLAVVDHATRERIQRCRHRTRLSSCGCDGYCSDKRGYLVKDLKTGDPRYLVNLDDCAKCDLLPT